MGSDPRKQSKARAVEVVDELAEELCTISHEIWEHPELCFEESFAHDRLCESLEGHGLRTQRHAYGLETAFEARAGTTGAEVGVLCEYDALPGIGHACGHNVIAAAALGAGLAAAAVAEEAGGRVRILGTPAEEGGGGKVFMAREGAFEGLAAAMMIHPADQDLATMDVIANQQVIVEYHGRAAHAAAAPHEGTNALDAAVIGYMAVAALRQHIRSDERIHGVFLDGGDKPNIVPAHASMHWYIRAADMDDLEDLKVRVLDALRSGATATGTEMTYEWQDPPYADMVTDETVLGFYAANAAALGRPVARETSRPVMGSTDMGNVSHEVPSIHPMIAVAPAGVAIHTPDFASHARGPQGDSAVLDGAKALACTVIDIWGLDRQ
jgi:amidohydrolase